MSRGLLIGIGVAVGVLVALPILAVQCKRAEEEDAAAAARKVNEEQRARRVSNPPPPDRGGFVIRRSDGSVAEQFWSAEACWKEWDNAYALMWEAQTEKGLKTESMRGCWSGPKPAPRTAPPAESLPEYRKRRNREAR